MKRTMIIQSDHELTGQYSVQVEIASPDPPRFGDRASIIARGRSPRGIGFRIRLIAELMDGDIERVPLYRVTRIPEPIRDDDPFRFGRVIGQLHEYGEIVDWDPARYAPFEALVRSDDVASPCRYYLIG